MSNPTNLGYPTAVNQGLFATLGDFLVVLDNDAVVTDGRLDQLVARTRRRSGYRRVHQQILPALRRANISVRWSDVVVRHTGYTDSALRGRKLVRDEAILRAELAERPDDPFVLFNLGSIAIERQDWRPAIPLLRSAWRGRRPVIRSPGSCSP